MLAEENISDMEVHGNTSVSILNVQYPSFDLRALIFVIIHCFVFVAAAIGNVAVFVNLYRSRRRKSRISLMFIHLSIADLIVTFIMLPIEIAWRVTIQWLGGNIACKILLFFRAFGLYLSSNVLICISFDRYFAVVHPLMMTNKQSRGKLMLSCAWITATLYAIPQIFIFHVEKHPQFPNFTQCVSFNFFSAPSHEVLYNVACLMAMYFIPLIVIICTYASILWEMWKKANNIDESHPKSSVLVAKRSQKSQGSGDLQVRPPQHRSMEADSGKANNSKTRLDDTTTSYIHGSRELLHKVRENVILRRSDVKCIERARIRTLKMTIIIIIVFLACWTPYVVMSMWYILDKSSAGSVPEWLQDILFMMAASNSCMNPIVYGRFTVRTIPGNKGTGSKLFYTFCCGNNDTQKVLTVNYNKESNIAFRHHQYRHGQFSMPGSPAARLQHHVNQHKSNKEEVQSKRNDTTPSSSMNKYSCINDYSRQEEMTRQLILQIEENDPEMGVIRLGVLRPTRNFRLKIIHPNVDAEFIDHKGVFTERV